jgi:hypothetical protein
MALFFPEEASYGFVLYQQNGDKCAFRAPSQSNGQTVATQSNAGGAPSYRTHFSDNLEPLNLKINSRIMLLQSNQ